MKNCKLSPTSSAFIIWVIWIVTTVVLSTIVSAADYSGSSLFDIGKYYTPDYYLNSPTSDGSEIDVADIWSWGGPSDDICVGNGNCIRNSSSADSGGTPREATLWGSDAYIMIMNVDRTSGGTGMESTVFNAGATGHCAEAYVYQDGVIDLWNFRGDNGATNTAYIGRNNDNQAGQFNTWSGSASQSCGLGLPTGLVSIAFCVNTTANRIYYYLNRQVCTGGSSSGTTFTHLEYYSWNTARVLIGNINVWNLTVGECDANPFDCQPNYTAETNPAVTLETPTSNNVTVKDVNFTFTVSISAAEQCTLMTNATGSWDKNVSISGSLLGTYDFGQVGINGTTGRYLWGVNCSLSGVLYWSTINNTLIVDHNFPTFILQPNNEWNENNLSNNNPYDDSFQVNVTFQDDRDLYIAILEITQGATTYFNYTNITSGSEFVLANLTNITAWPSGTYDIKIQVADSHTLQAIPDYSIKKQFNKLEFNTPEGNNLIIESDDPSITNAIKKGDRYSTEFEFVDGKTQERIFHVKSDNKITYLPDSEFPGHFVIWNSDNGNWIDFAGMGANPIVTKISDFHYTVTFLSLSSSVKFNSVGSLNTLIEYYTWQRGLYTLNDSDWIAGETGKFILNLTNLSMVSRIEANLVYNGTDQGINQKTITSQEVEFYETATNYPLVSEVAYYWNITVYQSDGSFWSFTAGEIQTIQDFGIFNCGAGSDTGTLTLYFYDENAPITTEVVTDVSINIESWVSNPDFNAKNFSANYTGASSYSICIGNQSVQSNIYFQFTRDSFTTTKYYSFNQTLTGNNLTLPLYLMASNTTNLCDLRITTRYEDSYKYFPNILVQLQREYPAENLYRTVQMGLSGGFGLVPLNVVEKTTNYKLLFLDTNNNVLKTLEDNVFVCTSGVSELIIVLNPHSEDTEIYPAGVSWTYDNNTGIITITWVSPDSNNIDISYSIDWIRSNGLSNICSQASSGTSGTFECNVSGYSGTVYLTVNSTRSTTPFYDLGTFISLVETKIGSFLDSRDGSFLAFLYLLPIVATGIIDPAAPIIAMIFSFIGMSYFGLLSFITVAFIITYTIGGVIVGLLIYK